MLTKNPLRWWPHLSLAVWLAGSLAGRAPAAPVAAGPAETWEAPAALALSPDGRQLFVACARTRRILVCNAASLEIAASVPVPDRPSGLAVAADGRTLYVTCAAPSSCVALVDIVQGKVESAIPAGHTAMGPVLSPDGATLYVCNRFNNNVSVIDLKAGKEIQRIAVDREPVAAAVTPDGRFLLVANHLHSGAADLETVAARVTVIDLAAGKPVQQMRLPAGSGLLRDIRVSPDGRYACATHQISRFQLPTTQVERGWMNSSAMTLIDLTTLSVVNTVLLDNVESGAANPWACGWTPDGKNLFVTHAGTHEVSVIDFPGLLAKLSKLPETLAGQATADYSVGSRVRSEVPSDLAFLTGLRQRIQIKGKGPRAALAHGQRIYVAGYFSDTLEAVDLERQPRPLVQETRLSPDQPMSVVRRGEFLFNDASICFQGWQSCASCHSEDARVDGLNWDLLNDGIGNPKNSKSLLFSHRTPPSMSLGVRETAETAVRAGIRSILFTVQPEEVPAAMDEWLKTLAPIPSPWLVDGKLSDQARRGERIFSRGDTRCASCHPQGLRTDLRRYDVGTRGNFDKPGDTFVTPTLIEIWRTAPYLHDGSAATLQEVLVEHNPSNRHGSTSQLSPAEIEDLVAYLLSL
jgi:YVTN family beta-propeller protein